MTLAIIIIIVVAVLAAAIIGYVFYAANQKKHTGELKGRFGPEYDRTVAASGGRKPAEQELAARQERVEKLDIRPLGETQRQDYVERWRIVQQRFVDDPAASLRDADRLVGDVMTARGYPMAKWDQRAADVSVDHPEVVANYRAGHDISLAMEAGKATTEQLRQAMVHYRTLFEDLLVAPEPAGARS